MNRVNARSAFIERTAVLAGNNQDMLIVRPMPLNEGDLLVNVALHPATDRRVKLREVADLQFADRRLAIADFREPAMIASSFITRKANCFVRSFS